MSQPSNRKSKEKSVLPRRSYSLEEWTRQHNISVRTGRRLVKKGDLKIFKIGGLLRISVEEAEDYIRRNTELRGDMEKTAA